MSEKKRTSIATLILTSFICLLPIALGFMLWDSLPEMIPQQYGWNDQVNWSLPKPLGFILCPVLMLLVNALVQLLFRLSKKELNRKLELLMNWLIPAISLLVGSLLVLKPAGLNISAFHAVIPIISLMFIILGNYLPKTEANGVVGIRAPWINENPDVWAKTNRFGGILLVILGIVNLICCFTPVGKYVFIISTLLVAVITLVYSIIVARKSKRGKGEA